MQPTRNDCTVPVQWFSSMALARTQAEQPLLSRAKSGREGTGSMFLTRSLCGDKV